jgi:mono/diheme cytochrome c family protein
MLTRIANATLPLATIFLLACGGGGAATGDTTPAGGTGAGGDEGQVQSGGEGGSPALVAEGATVFGEYCASCHGDQGEGTGAPAVAGSGALGAYATEQALFDYVKAEMPQDDPGSLSDDQYRAVVAWMNSKTGR